MMHLMHTDIITYLLHYWIHVDNIGLIMKETDSYIKMEQRDMITTKTVTASNIHSFGFELFKLLSFDKYDECVKLYITRIVTELI